MATLNATIQTFTAGQILEGTEIKVIKRGELRSQILIGAQTLFIDTNKINFK
jgi:hypothetical protein